ncbi:hypothetical protein ACOBV8_21665 (plasmid) [Pseudoalteromonas espejiana]
MDNSKSELSKFAAIAVAWLYWLRLWCLSIIVQTPLVENGKAFIAVVIGILALWTYGG